MVTESAVENILWAKAACFEYPVDVAVPDGDLIGT